VAPAGETMDAVCNASPLITLAKAGLLDLLPRLFSRVVVPDAVAGEILAGPADDPMKVCLDSCRWIERVRLQPPVTALSGLHLGQGESEVIEWAAAHPGAVAVLDDRAARRAAVAVGVNVLGTLGVLARAAAQTGIGVSFSDSVAAVQRAGLYLDPRVVATMREELGE